MFDVTLAVPGDADRTLEFHGRSPYSPRANATQEVCVEDILEVLDRVPHEESSFGADVTQQLHRARRHLGWIVLSVLAMAILVLVAAAGARAFATSPGARELAEAKNAGVAPAPHATMATMMNPAGHPAIDEIPAPVPVDDAPAVIRVEDLPSARQATTHSHRKSAR